jgi:DNA-binding transcriptional MerR regulator
MKEAVMSENHSLTLVLVAAARPAAYSLATAAELAGVHPEMLRYYCRLGLLGEARARAETDPTFDDDALYELRRFENYRREHAVDRATLRLICGLRREVERLEAELRFRRGP